MLTASGGPFRGRTREELREVTPEQALAHPTWAMGPVVTTNSATLVNKGLEVIEAHLLFGIDFDRIDVVVHPQSVVHSMVEFIDGSTSRRLTAGHAAADRAGPGLARPAPGRRPGLRLHRGQPLGVLPAGRRRVPRGGPRAPRGSVGRGRILRSTTRRTRSASKPSWAGRIRFGEIVETVARVVGDHAAGTGDLSLDDVLAADAWARRRAHQVLSVPAARGPSEETA